MQEEERMNVEQELATAHLKIKQMSIELNTIAKEKDNELALVQQQIEVYQEKINILESRLQLVFYYCISFSFQS